MSHFSYSAAAAQFAIRWVGTETHVHLTGVWSVSTIHTVENSFIPHAFAKFQHIVFDLSEVTQFDTAAALMVNDLVADLTATGKTASIVSDNPQYTALLAIAKLPPLPEKTPPTTPVGFKGLLYQLGLFVSQIFVQYGQQIGFLGNFLVILAKTCKNPRNFRITSLVNHMEQTGLRAVPIIALLTFLIGMVVAYMGAQELAKFGAQVFAVNLLQVTILREMGVLITAIVVAGRSSSSFTAQIGAMVANEEVAAIQSMGLKPMDLLVLPRIVALMITLPVLVFLGDIAAIFGGAVALWYSMDLTLYGFIIQLHSVSSVANFMVGMVKTPFFAIIIGIVGCYQGFQANSSAESVGLLTTISVVQSIFFVIVLDALFAIFFTALGI